ncbi:hypothetical protein BJF88_08320 [Cellulosimicrobium sp. CUA-896]|nr:hypothetical protein BJF88_08320 [Cellulosimicrobium sp. CUA-896]
MARELADLRAQAAEAGVVVTGGSVLGAAAARPDVGPPTARPSAGPSARPGIPSRDDRSPRDGSTSV